MPAAYRHHLENVSIEDNTLRIGPHAFDMELNKELLFFNFTEYAHHILTPCQVLVFSGGDSVNFIGGPHSLNP